MTVFAVATGKGGGLKSTTAAHLADELARQGRRVVVLELDRQGDCSTWLGVLDDAPAAAVSADVLSGSSSINDAAVPTAIEGIAVVQGTQGIGRTPEADDEQVIETLRAAIAGAQFDDVVIDNAPALGVVTTAALAGADVIIAPCLMTPAGWRQVPELEAFIARDVARYRTSATLDFIVPGAVDTRESLPRQLEDDLRDHYGAKVTPRVRRAAVVEWAWLEGNRPVTRYAPSSGVAWDFRSAMSYIIRTAQKD